MPFSPPSHQVSHQVSHQACPTGPAWRRAARCSSSTCVEVALHDDLVAVRDSKVQDGPVLIFDHAEWSAFVAGVKAGEFDLRPAHSYSFSASGI